MEIYSFQRASKKKKNLNNRRIYLKKLEKVKASRTEEINQTKADRKINQHKAKIIYLKKLTKLTKPLATQTKKKKKKQQKLPKSDIIKKKSSLPTLQKSKGYKSNKSNIVNSFTPTNRTA